MIYCDKAEEMILNKRMIIVCVNAFTINFKNKKKNRNGKCALSLCNVETS